MCGIVGWLSGYGSTASVPLVQMLDTLRHRGPDDHGWAFLQGRSVVVSQNLPEIDSAVTLGHRRLSILDLSAAGRQPMCSPNGDFVIAYNGELYNYLELRSELEGLGYSFGSRSDTEVLLTCWREWGSRCLGRFLGMFAFVLVDVKRRQLILARDPFGIKPLYYAFHRGGLAVSSEIPPLLKLPGFPRRPNQARIYDYLRFGLTDHHDETSFQGILQVPAGHYLTVSLDRPEQVDSSRYATTWDPMPIEISLQQASQRLRTLFLESVQLHLRSDVPVGTALSGGIDSSAIVCAIRTLSPRQELHAFSFVAEGASGEEKWIDVAGTAARAIIHKVKPAPSDLRQDLNRLIIAQGEPFGSTSIYAQYRVFQEARRHGVVVMLDGQGADELLAGYERTSAARLASSLARLDFASAARYLWRTGNFNRLQLLRTAGVFLLPSRCVQMLRSAGGRGTWPQWLNRDWFAQAEQPVTCSAGRLSSDYLRAELIQSIRRAPLPSLLRYEDRSSMIHSIESRVPFLTPALAQFTLNLPEEHLISSTGETKHVFRKAMLGIVPDSILHRRDKVAFATPEGSWLRHLDSPLRDLLSPEGPGVSALNARAVQTLADSILRGKGPTALLWRWINFLVWSRAFDVSQS